MRTYDGGDNWLVKNLNISGSFTDVDFYNENKGVVVGKDFAYSTSDGGYSWHSWTPYSTSLFGVSYLNENIAVACGFAGRIVRTTDGGIHWNALSNLILKDLNDICFTESGTGIMAGKDGTILKSTSAGTNWTYRSTGLSNNLFSVFFTDELHGIAVGESGVIIRTSDGGDSWTQVPSNTNRNLYEVHFKDDSTGIITADDGFLKTTDKGSTWHWFNSSGKWNAVTATTSGVWIVAGDAKFLKNSGGEWELRYPLIPDLYALSFKYFWKGTIVGEKGSILRSTNECNSWYSQESNTINDLYGVSFLDNTWEGVAVGASGTILRTTNGGFNWLVCPSGTTQDLHGVFHYNRDTIVVVGNEGTIIRTSDGGTTWNHQSSHTLNNLYAIHKELIVGQTGKILKTNDFGITWAPIPSGTPYDLYCVFQSYSGYSYAAGLKGTIITSLTGGQFWSPSSNGTNLNIYGMFFQGNKTGTTVGAGGLIFKTTNGGGDWYYRPIDITDDLKDISFYGNDGIAVGSNGTILKVINGGGIPVELNSFTYSVYGPQVTLNWSTVTEINNFGFEVQRKLNGQWNTVGFASGTGTTTEVSRYSFTDDLSGYENGGILLYRLKQVDFNGLFEYSDELEVSFALDYSLSQNYPNPFNPSTVISYSLPEYSQVIIKIFDILGRELITLVQDEKPAGKYEVEWNASGISAGLYFYQFKAGNFVETKKMILLR